MQRLGEHEEVALNFDVRAGPQPLLLARQEQPHGGLERLAGSRLAFGLLPGRIFAKQYLRV